MIQRESARRHFRREALLLQHVSHPHVVKLLEAMETPNSYYLVLELAEKGHLQAYITDRWLFSLSTCLLSYHWHGLGDAELAGIKKPSWCHVL